MSDFNAFTDEFCKLAAQPITRDEAERSLGKLKDIEDSQDMGALGRSAATGAAIMPVAGLAARGVAGTQKLLKPGAKIKGRNPLSLAKAIDWKSLGRQGAADSMYGAIGGGALPLAREKVETTAQKEKLRTFIDQEEGNRGPRSLRRQIRQSVGV